MRNWVAIKNGVVIHVDQNKNEFDEAAFAGVEYDSISTDDQKFHSVGDTFDISQCTKNGHEYAFKNGVLYGYTTSGSSGFVENAYNMQDQLMYTYGYDDSSCSFYSDRTGGRKKYFVRDAIPAQEHNRHPGQRLNCYAELNGTPAEWYYSFDSLIDAESFASQFTSAPLVTPALRNEIIAKPWWYASRSTLDGGSCLMSVEDTGSGYVVSLYVYLTPAEADF